MGKERGIEYANRASRVTPKAPRVPVSALSVRGRRTAGHRGLEERDEREKQHLYEMLLDSWAE